MCSCTIECAILRTHGGEESAELLAHLLNHFQRVAREEVLVAKVASFPAALHLGVLPALEGAERREVV